MASRLTSTHFVGRTGELAELELALGEAEHRQPVLVLLGGDSGVGKTRLVGEFERRAGGEGALVLRGEGIELGDGELPYAPLLGALRPVVRGRHPALDELSPGARTQLAALLPALGDGRSAPAEYDPVGQLRLFESLLELIDLLSESAPLALVLEDMHWADRSTRSFVQFLARSLREERVLMMLTYRTDEMHRRHPLRALLAELERLERARRIDLVPFDRAELTEALTDILGDVPGEQLVERLFGRSEGNALYTEELLAAGLDGRGAAPKSLRDAFMLRIERLSADAQRALRPIAIAQGLDQETVAALTGIDNEQLRAALREAVAEQVLVAGEDDRFSFRHALLSEALHDDLLPGERGELHIALARALEQRTGAAPGGELERAATIAHHYAAAGDQPAALRATVYAARVANRSYAYAEAAALAERALELWPRVPDAGDATGTDHVGLLSLAADANDLGEDRVRGQHLLQAALKELDAERDPQRYAGLLTRLAVVQWALNEGPHALASAQRALAMLPAGDFPRERARLLAWLARTRFLRGRFRDSVTDAEEALAAAVAANDAIVEAEILNTLGMARIALGEVDEGVASLRHALEISRERGDSDGLSSAYSNLADMLNLAGRSATALETAMEGLAAIPGRVTTRSRDWIELTVSELAFELGDWRTAREHLRPKPSRLLGRLLIFRQLREAELALGEGNEEIAARCLEAIEPIVAASWEPQWHGVFGALLGELHRRRGDLDYARGAVDEALDRLELCTDDVMRIARVTAIGLVVEADQALRARDLGDRARARDALARARIHMRRLQAAAEAGGPVEAAWCTVGAAALARARGKNSAASWRKAASAWDELARPYSAALARWREAEALVEAGDRDGAAPVALGALETATRLGARWLAAEISGLSGRARLDLTASGEGLAPAADAEPTDPFGLTPRERQVLLLVAQGATNRQIGAALFMAEKTASVHVSRILGKLGVRTRTQAAAVAHRQQLA